MMEKLYTSTSDQALAELRDRIDGIDAEIQQLINQRARCAQQVAEVKERARAAEHAVVFYRPEREAQVLRRVMARNQGPLSDQAMARLFREIMSVCLALEQPLRVACIQSEQGDTERALLKHFGQFVEPVVLAGLEEVFAEIDEARCHYALVSIAATQPPLLAHTLALLWQHDVLICGEVELPLPSHQPTARYLILGRQTVAPSGVDKTSLLLRCDTESVQRLLASLLARGVEVTCADAQMHPQASERLVLLDIQGHAEDDAVTEVMDELRAASITFKHLGSYPQAVL